MLYKTKKTYLLANKLNYLRTTKISFNKIKINLFLEFNQNILTTFILKNLMRIRSRKWSLFWLLWLTKQKIIFFNNFNVFDNKNLQLLLYIKKRKLEIKLEKEQQNKRISSFLKTIVIDNINISDYIYLNTKEFLRLTINIKRKNYLKKKWKYLLIIL